MTKSELLIYPGEIVLNFILSLFNSHPAAIDQGLYNIIAGLFALVIWSWVIRICWELIKKAFGFGGGRYVR